MNKTVRDMAIGDSGYIVSWAIQMVFGRQLINLNYDLAPVAGGTRTVHLTRTEDGYIATGWIAESNPVSHAVISIITSKYPWTGATDDDVAGVVIAPPAELGDADRDGGADE